ncbi:4-hydroxy-2-oxoheptanedioate aldolase [Pseudaminobacter salicylatoxidans]|uniref:4-hydroxy-2-oxoheptanedioate aldolase n=1 Tax=Pseudaminobacter salicylatoxidans TaxID=93369 RepID=A0A316C8V0_PSESE|nr:HpcH/HpaI aldolase/citrate lyase family protein [Pseudaminobacter salicylatoxidans]PWJ85898.1 4-hydroxy-2-oxoheptanedioate aldolase [Pseudaminobacter salicylatoxidans]
MTFASRLNNGETLITAWSSVPDALTVEIVAAQGFDAVVLDMQHGGHHEDSVLRSVLPVLRAGRHPVVRIPVGRFDMASRALDFGAEAVIAPMINSEEDARGFAAAMKYPPVGERSWGPTFAAPRHGNTDSVAWLHESNARTVSFAMIETRAALNALDGILETPGIDGIFVGPADFSIAWTEGGTVDSTLEDMMETLARIAARAKEAGKHAGMYVVDAAMCGRFVEMGYRFLALGTEHRYIALGADSLLKAAHESLGTPAARKTTGAAGY